MAPMSRDEIPARAEVLALRIAASAVTATAPSSRWNRIRAPLESTMAMLKGGQPLLLERSRHRMAMRRATSCTRSGADASGTATPASAPGTGAVADAGAGAGAGAGATAGGLVPANAAPLSAELTNMVPMTIVPNRAPTRMAGPHRKFDTAPLPPYSQGGQSRGAGPAAHSR